MSQESVQVTLSAIPDLGYLAESAFETSNQLLDEISLMTLTLAQHLRMPKAT